MSESLSESFTRMVDQTGRPLEWLGKWRVRVEGYVQFAEPTWDVGVFLPAEYPKSYYKAGVIRDATGAV